MTDGVFTSVPPVAGIPGKPAVTATGSSGEAGIVVSSDTSFAILANSGAGTAISAIATADAAVVAQSETGPGVLAQGIQSFGVQAFGGGAVPIVPPNVSSQGGIFAGGGQFAGLFATNGTDQGLSSDAAVHAVSAGTPPSSALPTDLQTAMFAEGGLGIGLLATGPTEAQLGSPESSEIGGIGVAISAQNSYGDAIDATSAYGTAVNASIQDLGDVSLPPSVTGAPPPGICITAINPNPQLAILAGTTDTQENPSDCIKAVTIYGSGIVGCTGALVDTSASAGVVGVTAGPQETGQHVTGVMGTTTSAQGIGVTADGGTDINGTPIGAVALKVQNGTIAIEGNSAGSVAMTAGKKTLTVPNAAATANSLIFLTPLGNPDAFLWIKARIAGSFTIEASTALPHTVNIGFLIIN